jgi:acyl-CoA thioester hydrolase
MPAEAGVSRGGFRIWRAMPTRWMDNDHYGHVNNVVYYSYFDTAVNGYLIEAAGCDIRELDAVGLVAETSCRFLKSISFPDELEIGLRVERLGRSSIVYGIAVFRKGDEAAAAIGRFVHVYVDRASRRSVEVPEPIRRAVAALL